MKLINKLKDNFTVIDNNVLKLKEISLQAKGLYVILISLPDEWDFSAKGLASLSFNRIDGTKSALKELESFGLLKRKKFQDEKGRWSVQYTIYDLSTREKNNDF